MSDQDELLRDFGGDLPVPSVETRQRIYAYATQESPGRARPHGRMMVFRRSGASTANSSRPGMFRWGIGLVAVLLAAGGAAAFTVVTASGGQDVSSFVSAVQSRFGDGLLVSGSVTGSTLTVTVASPNEPSAVKAAFEAQMVAYALRDSQSASSQTPINSVQYVAANGKQLPGYGSATVASTRVTPLAGGACSSAATAVQAADASLTTVSALTLHNGGGACALKFTTTDPVSFAQNASTTLASMGNAIGNPNQRSYLVEVDDQAGTPQFVASYTPGAGGVSYIKPGLSTSFAGVSGGRLRVP